MLVTSVLLFTNNISKLFLLYSCRTTPPGKLFKAILTSPETGYRPDESAVIESVFLHNNKAVDLVLGEEEGLHYPEQSPESSPESSTVSEPGDPLYDESLLKDLFYTTPVNKTPTFNLTILDK